MTTIPLSSLSDQRICPVAAWDLYRHMLPGINPSKTTPLLLTTAPPIGKTISASTLRAMFHRATQIAGLSDRNYTPHSLRRGGASFCFQAGVPLEHIKKHGTWSSQAVDRYLLQHQAFHLQWHIHFGNSSMEPMVKVSHRTVGAPIISPTSRLTGLRPTFQSPSG